MSDDHPLHQKFYRIGDAAALLGLKPYVLRFWETEFPHIRPMRSDTGQRLYTEEHVERIRELQDLLHVQGLTIDGAKKKLNEGSPNRTLLLEMKRELEEIRHMLLSSNMDDD